jgi:hypothetical protein
MVAGVDPGVSLAEGLRDATITALQTGVPVTLSHKDKQYLIMPDVLMRLIAAQTPLVTGKVTMQGGR